jgi:predicted dithiol-disulfide oxidoreductase (DUF899 family)
MKTKKKTKAPLKPKIVPPETWVKARKKFLAKEKAFTRQRDRLSAERRKLPWVRVEKEYVFDARDGKVGLSDLFRGKSQLIVYHFMFDPKWEEGCPSCSYLSDHYDGALIHLEQRDVAFAAVSRAPFGKIEAFKHRMGWRFPWVSSNTSDFNYDFGVSFSKEGIAKGQASYNYEKLKDPDDAGEGPGLSVFVKDKSGRIYHTYSTYARGLDILVGTYNFLDLVPKGRDEDKLKFPMAWVRHHDKYGGD